MQFFFLLGQLPGGIEIKDLEKIWKYIQETGVSDKEKLRKILTFDSKKSSSITDLTQSIKEDMPWQTAINQLEMKHLIESHFSKKVKHVYQNKARTIDLSENEED